ncbi:hypothetical protein B0O80DRAFT_502981 [Mortierella sp. GBAus27b]|nr:hypothetical protein B0O80DRAFT_502981 [Mortierella sp. GBAus27b]
MIERLHSIGLSVSVRTAYGSSVLRVPAQEARVSPRAHSMEPDSTGDRNTDAQDTTFDWFGSSINHIIAQTLGRLSNIAKHDSPSSLQDGILFHHILATHGEYLLSAQMATIRGSCPDMELPTESFHLTGEIDVDRFAEIQRSITIEHASDSCRCRRNCS